MPASSSCSATRARSSARGSRPAGSTSRAPPTPPTGNGAAVPDEYLAAWSDLGGGPQLSTALKIRLDLDDIAANTALLPGRVHELTYEELITEPEPTLRELCRFAELEWTPAFARIVAETEFYDSTKTWRKHLTDAEGDRVLEFMRGPSAPSFDAAADQERGLPKSRSSAGTVIRMILKSSQGERFSM